jgi:hypothetical protein
VGEPGDILQYHGGTGEGRPDRSLLVQRQTALGAIFNPQAPHVEGGLVSAAKSSPFAIEVLAAPGPGLAPAPRRPSIVAGRYAYVELKKKETYQVRLVNNSDCEMYVELSIDGLNLFAFSAFVGCKYVVVPARGSVVVPGWHRTSETVDEFLVDEYSKAGKHLCSPAAVGVITAVFRASWRKDEPPPPDELLARVGRLSGEPLHTTQGTSKFVHSERVERVIGAVRACVSVRYNK